MTFIPEPAQVQAISYSSVGNIVPNSSVPNTQTTLLVYQITDPTNLNDLLLTGLQIDVTTRIGTKFTYSVYAGNPTSGGRLLFNSPDTIITNLQGYIFDNSKQSVGYSYKSGAFASVMNADARNGIYLLVTNMVSSGFTFDAAINFLMVPSSQVSLPSYTPSTFTYTGPSGLTSVDVGPGLTFPEPEYAMPYVAPGFTMTVHPGTYFLPFVVQAGFDGFTIQAAAGANADTIIFNGRGGFLTGIPPFIDNNSVSVPPANPFRLAQGKGFIVCYSLGTISGIGFLDCGGGYGVANNTDTTMQSESGIWLGCSEAGDIYITRCVFNGGADGVFALNGAPFTLHLDHCDFSLTVGCATECTGHTHNVYLNNLHVIATNCNFYAAQNGHAFKSRALTVSATNCFFQAGSSSSSSTFNGAGGRAFEMPDGGVGTLTNCRLSQKPTMQTSTNFIGFCDESYINGATSSLTLTNCEIDIVRYSSWISLGSPGGHATVTATGLVENIYTSTGLSPPPSLSYAAGDQGSGITGIVLGDIGGSGFASPATVISGSPATVPSPAHLA